MGLSILRAPATWWGIPNTIAYLRELNFESVSDKMFMWGRNWRKLEYENEALNKKITFLLEMPYGFQLRLVENYDYIVYPFHPNDPYYLGIKKRMRVTLFNNFGVFYVVQPPLYGSSYNITSFVCPIPYWYFLVQFPDKNAVYFKGQPVDFQAETLTNKSYSYNFAVTNFFLTVDEERNAVAGVTALWHGKDEPYISIDLNNVPATMLTFVDISDYVAVKVLEGVFSANTTFYANWYFVVESPKGLTYVAGNPAYATSLRPLVLRKAFYFVAPTSYEKSGGLVDGAAGTYRINWDFLSCELETYQPFQLGDFILVIADDNYFIYKVTKVDVQYQPESPPVYKVSGVNPIDDEGSVIECEFSPNLLPVHGFVAIAKGLCHFPNQIIVPDEIRNVILLDEEKKTFKTLREFIDYLQNYFFGDYGGFILQYDSNYNLVISFPTEVAGLPDLPLLSVTESEDIDTPSVVVTPRGYVYNPILLAQRGVVISQSQPAPATKEYSFTFLGFAYYPVNQPIQINENEVGLITDIRWDADASGNVRTEVKVVIYNA